MPGEANSHARAVAAFARLANAPGQSSIGGPAALSRAAGLPQSSGYRAAGQAEAAGLLVRDTEGVYRAGPAAIRIGLSALGFGDLSYFAEPILVETRYSVGATACLAVLAGDKLKVGPWSTGRGRDYVRPGPLYHWHGERPRGGPVTAMLTVAGDEARRHRFRLVPLCEREGRIACLTAILPAGMVRLPEAHERALTLACERFASVTS